MKKNEILSDSREDAYKLVITISLLFSVGSILTLCLIVPAMYNYVQNVGSYSSVDLTFCDDATNDIELEMTETKHLLKTKLNSTRTKRQYNGGAVTNSGPVTFYSGNVGFQECPACCVPGARGPNGDPGIPGLPGAPGPNGAKGRPGTTPNATCIPERVFEPPPCLPCPQGPRGPPGHPGFPGDPGDPGINGRPGRNGNPGPRGPAGPEGPPGDRGEIGQPGDKGVTPNVNSVPGEPGEPGDPGPWGLPGHPGQLGENGYPGAPGERGWPGPPGLSGPVGGNGPNGPPGEIGPPGTPGTCVCQETEVIVEDTRVPYNQYGGGTPGRAGYIRLPSHNNNWPKETASYVNQIGNLKADENTQTVQHESNSGVVPEDVKVLPEKQVQMTNENQPTEYNGRPW